MEEKQEAIDEMISRHRKEMIQLQTREAELNQAAYKKLVEDVFLTLLPVLKEKYADEIASLGYNGSSLTLTEDDERSNLTPLLNAVGISVMGQADQSEPSKNEKKIQKRVPQEEAQREQRIKQELCCLIRGSLMENENLAKKIEPFGLTVQEIKRDGHCMYRAVEDHLRVHCPESSHHGYLELRKLVATYMRENDSHFLPIFHPVDAKIARSDVSHSEKFKKYCEKVESTAELGGRLELKALAQILKKHIMIFAGFSPEWEIGEEYKPGEASIFLSYHVAAGRLPMHYNSLVPCSQKLPTMDSQVATSFHLSQVGSNRIDEANVISPFPLQSTYPTNASLISPQIPNLQLPNSFIGLPNQVSPSNQFQMNYAFHPTDFNPHLAQQYPLQRILNPPCVSFDNHRSTSSKQKGKKRKNDANTEISDIEPPQRRTWSKEEDVALTKAWLHISVDSNIGTDQPTNTLWRRIQIAWKEFLADEFIEERSTNALAKRWCIMQASINKYHRIYERLEMCQKSGRKSIDLKKDSYKMYKESNKEKKPFSYEHCWDECKKNAKWCTQQLTTSSSKSSTQSPNDDEHFNEDNTVNLVNDCDGIARPPGRKTSRDINKMQWQEKGVVEDNTTNEVNDCVGIARPPGRKNSNDKKKMQWQEKGVVEDNTTNGDITTNEVNDCVGIARPPGRLTSKHKKNMQWQEKGVVEVLNNLQTSIQQQFSHNKEEMEVKKEIAITMKKEYELRELALKKELEYKEKELTLKEKAQRRRDQQKILNQDLSKLTPLGRSTIEKMQEKILKEWAAEECAI